MKSVSVAKLEEKFKGEGMARFKEIALIGGFGEVEGVSHEASLSSDAHLDLVGVLDPENKAVSVAAKNKIRELAGIEETKSDAKADKEVKK